MDAQRIVLETKFRVMEPIQYLKKRLSNIDMNVGSGGMEIWIYYKRLSSHNSE